MAVSTFVSSEITQTLVTSCFASPINNTSSRVPIRQKPKRCFIPPRNSHNPESPAICFENLLLDHRTSFGAARFRQFDFLCIRFFFGAQGPWLRKRGQADKFMIEFRDLGSVNRMTIGHDGVGKDNDWFIDKIVMRDLGSMSTRDMLSDSPLRHGLQSTIVL